MKISVNRIREIALEVIKEVLEEGGALCHDDKGHFSDCEAGSTYSLSKSGAKKAKVSDKFIGRGKVTKRVKKEDDSYVLNSKAGLNTSDKKQGGRKKFPDGSDISPKYSVSKYPKTYTEEKSEDNTEDKTEDKTEWDPSWKSSRKRKADHRILKPSHSSWIPAKQEMSQTARGVGLGIFESDETISLKELSTIIEEAFPSEALEERVSDFTSKCRAQGLISMSEAQKRILLSLNAFAKAQDGSLGKKD
tara:strand:- start:18 stop:761 length:744 start_codon:yes stop_codon:yes gene_type:complete